MKRKFVSFFILVIMISACTSTKVQRVSITATEKKKETETDTSEADKAIEEALRASFSGIQVKQTDTGKTEEFIVEDLQASFNGAQIKETETGEPEVSIAAAAENKPKDNIAFIDLKTFDKKLSKAMKTDQEKIEVDLISQFTTNEIPERLGKWFSVVDKYEGKVQVQSLDPQTRGFPGIGLGVSLVVSAYKAIRGKILYGPAKSYDATLLYHPSNGVVEKIVFTRRPESY